MDDSPPAAARRRRRRCRRRSRRRAAVCLLAASTSGGRVRPRIANVCWHVAEIALCVQPLRSEEALCMELMIACFRWAAALSIRQMATRLRTAAEAAARSVTRPLELR